MAKSALMAMGVPALLLSQTALAQSQKPGGGLDLAASTAVGSDYVWRGITQTDGDPAVFATVTASVGGFYLGAGTENVKFGQVRQEYDAWGGYVVKSGEWSFDVGLSFYGYVDSPDPIDTLEVKGAITRATDNSSVGLAAYYTRNYFGTRRSALYLEANGSRKITNGLSASGSIGVQRLAATKDYLTWNAGLSYDLLPGLKADLRYHDMTDDPFGGAGRARLVATATYGF